MPPFNATDSIFFGFRLFKRDPLMAGALAALLAVTTLIYVQLTWRQSLAYAAEYLAFQEAIEAAGGSQEAATEAFGALLGAAGAYLGDPAVLLGLLLMVLVRIAMQGAILRALVLDRRGGWVMGIGLGGDELRIFVVSLVTGLILAGGSFVGLIVVSIAAGILSFVHPALSGLIGFLGLLALMGALLLGGARLSAATAASVGEGRFIVLGSWAITRGRMWSLLGAYVILIFLTIVAQLALFVMSAVLAADAAALIQGYMAIDGLENPGAAFLKPGYILLTLLNAILEVGVLAAFCGVGAYAYRWLGAAAGYPNAQPPADAPFRAPV